MSERPKQRVLILFGGENATLPRAELIAWLATTKSLNVEPLLVADDVPNSEGSVHDRVTSAIREADKAIAVVTLDGRSKSGAPNVIEEIGRWLQGKSARTLCVIRQQGIEINSNLHGHVYLSFTDRIKEAWEGLRKFLAEEIDEDSTSFATSSLTIESNPTNIMLDSRLYNRVRVEEVELGVTAVLACDGTAEAALRALGRRAPVELTYGNHVVRGTLDECRFTHEGSQQLAKVTVGKRQNEQHQGHMHDMAWGGGANSMTADEIAELRARRLLTGEPKAKKSDAFGGPEMLIRGGLHDGLQVDESPIPQFLATLPRSERSTWEHLRLELVRQLILSRCVERIEHLRLTVDAERLVRVEFRGLRYRAYSNVAPFAIAIDAPVAF
jgi:hypothetical protein